jgi:hypothetical protein
MESKFVKESKDLIKSHKLPQTFDFYKSVFRKAHESITGEKRDYFQNLLMTKYVDFMEEIAGDFFKSETLKKKVKFAELKLYFPIGLPGMVQGHENYQKVQSSNNFAISIGFQ